MFLHPPWMFDSAGFDSAGTLLSQQERDLHPGDIEVFLRGVRGMFLPPLGFSILRGPSGLSQEERDLHQRSVLQI